MKNRNPVDLLGEHDYVYEIQVRASLGCAVQRLTHGWTSGLCNANQCPFS